MNRYAFFLITISYLSGIAAEPIPPDEDPGWKNDPGIIQTLEWHPSPSSQMGKRSFVLRNSETEKALESSPLQNARLLGTAHLLARDSPSCLAFVYQTTGENKKTKLTISINNKLLWRSRFRRENTWTEIRLNISSSSSVGLSRSASVIVFDGQLANNDKDAQIQLENISIINAPCRTSNKTPSRRSSRAIKASPSRQIRSVSRSTKAVPGYDCNFEQDMCGWTQGPNATLDWIREQAASNTLVGIVGPNGDHTFGNATGFYLIAKLQLPVSNFDDFDISSIVSPRLPENTPGSMCAEWWYMMHGTDSTEFNLYLIANDDFGTLTSIWRRFGDHGSHWQHGQIEIEPGKNITHVMFEVTAAWSIRSTVALDDLQLIDGPCIKPDFHAIACTFEEGHICGYSSDPTGNIAWTRIQGSTPSFDTGANEDHTLGTEFGHFMYIETSSPQKPGDTARLLSVYEPSAYGRCLEFWYHQYGADIGKLNIYIEMNTTGGSSSKTLVWSRGANVGNVWRKGHIATEYTEPFRVIFEGVVGKSFEGDIALDDVERLAISCKEPNNCDFEQDTFCGWENVEKTDNFDWEITSGPSDPDLLTGPLSDHTLGTLAGAYAFIDTRMSRKENETARLISQSMAGTDSNGMCLEFFYHMYGLGIGTLTVYLQQEGFTPLPMWTLYGEQEDDWLQGKVGFIVNSDHSILFEAKIASPDEGDVAIDDVAITNGYCTVQPSFAQPGFGLTTPTTQPTTIKSTTPHVPSLFDCNFETDPCSPWRILSRPQFSWSRTQAVAAFQDDAQNMMYDHSSGMPDGHYLVFKPNDSIPLPDTAVTTEFRSSQLTDSRACLEFWYFIVGSSAGTLSVTKVSGSIFNQERWTTTGGKDYAWFHAQVNLLSSGSNPANYEISIGARWSSDNRGTVGIDDITLLNGTCRTSSDQCDFDSDDSICGFQHDPTGQFNWTRGLASAVQTGSNPNIDHTTQTGEGYYMFVEGKNRNANERARLLTPIQERTTGSCVHFWYFQHAQSQQMKLNVFLSAPQSPILFSHDGSLDNRWFYTQINVFSANQSWQAVFEGEILAQNADTSVAIDDVSITRGLCPKPGDCTFDIDLCGWNNAKNNTDFDWIVGQGIHSFGTGPQFDHTTNTAQGKYLMIETSLPTQPGYRARLESMVLDGTNDNARCFRFWYHMYGTSIGTLNVYLFNGTDNHLWSLSGNRGDKWFEGQVSYSSSINHQIIVEGIAGKDFLGDISIDDFSFTTSNCSIRPLDEAVPTLATTLPPFLTTTTTPRTTLAPQSPWDCNFEQGVLCPTWTHDVTADFRWELKQGRTPSGSTGPTVDHTFGTADGWYIYMEASYPQKYNQRCRIISEEIQGMKCLQFWYHMYGMDVDTLNIYIQSNGQRGKPVWTRARNQGDQWLRGQYSISPANANSKYQIVFEAIVGKYGLGDIALDDIVVYASCPQNSDRLCTFEEPTLCNYVNDGKSQYNWTRTTGSDSSGGTFKPNVDHTDGTSNGAYMLIDLSRSSTNITDEGARLISPIMIPNGEQCVEFWYYSNGNILSSASALSVYVRTQTQPSNSTGFLIWSKRTELDGQWRISQQRIPHGLSLTPYQLILQGSIYKNGADSPAIAIDDVFIRDRACLSGGDCDFENGLCTWRSLFLFGNASWMIGSGSAQSPYNGPLNDHTLGTETGQYLLLSSAFTNQESVVAVVQSETFPPTSTVGQCLTFWYVLRGNQLGSLDVNISTGQESVKIWTTGSIDQGDIWHFGSMGFYIEQEYNIVIEGSINALTQGYYAIDDIDVRDGYCGVIPTGASVTHLTTPQTVTRPSTAFQIPTIYDCTFEADFCSWTHMDDAILNWTRNQGSTDTFETGPLFDVTTQTNKGWYIYLETSAPVKLNDTARIKSPAIAGSTRKCFEFWYHMNGPDINRLDILTIDSSNVETVVWTREGSQGNIWRLGKVKLNDIPDMYSIIAQGVAGISFQGDIALDEFKLIDGNCPSDFPFECDFDDPNLCGFTNDPTGQYNWIRHKGATPGTLNGPSFDHTTLTAQGYYMYITAASSSLQGKKGRLISPWMNNTNGQCVSFWYHSYGADVGALTVYKLVSSTNDMFPMWRINYDFGDIWNAAEISIYKTDEPWAIVFESEYGQGFLGDLAIDDVVIRNGQCSPLGSCTFETLDFCTWHNVRKAGQDEFDWLLGHGETDSAFTGPTVDHTFNDAFGYYAFIEASYPRLQNDRAILESTVLTPTSAVGSCLSFWYHMFGETGYLNVYINGTRSREPLWIWTQKGDKGDKWFNGQVTIRSSSYYRLQIEGVIGPTFQGDTAIDDLLIFDNPCVLMPSNANPAEIPPTTTSTQPPFITRPLGPYDCNFENETLCSGWENKQNNQFDWQRVQGLSVAAPHVDHTTNTGQGYFIQADLSKRQPNDMARYKSPLLNEPLCMTFYYHLFGHAGSLNIYMALGDNLGIQLWTRQGTQGDIWRFGRLSTNKPGANVIFEAVAGANAVGDVSIDDVIFTPGVCSESTAVGESCTFIDYSICGFTQNTTASTLIWQTYSGGEQRSGALPFDHTTGTNRGSYVYIDLDGQGENLNGRLISPIYPTIINQSLCLEFYYALVGSGNTFNVYMESATGTRRLIFTRNYDHGQIWNKGEATISSSNEYQIIFEIITGRIRAGLIALDDYMVKEGQCGMRADECTFDDGTLCAWTNAPNNQFDWLLQKGETSSLDTGPPSGDHGTGDGYYIFIETSIPAEPGWKARLESEIYLDNRVKCVSFWYNMYGVDIGRLNFYIRSLTSTNSSSDSLIWTLAGPQGKEWKHGFAPIQPSGRYQIIVEGIRGKSFEGDIAIDDLGVLNNDACSLQPIDADPIQVSIESISCRFETDLCQWKHDPTGQFNWTRHTESTPSLDTGPTSGADNSPYYIYIEASAPQKPSDRAGLISPVITKPKRTSCFSFYYHMWGENIGALLISTIQNLPNGDKQQTYIWQRNETQSKEWRVAQINLRNIPNDFAIQIDGYVGNSFEGDIAVDEIWLTDQECPPPTSCDFELDFCGWTNDTTADFFWTRAQKETTSIGTGPSTDHTTQTERGYYLYIETSSPQLTGHKARIISPMYTPSSSVCLRFYYHMFGPSIGTLNVLIAGSRQLLWTKSGNLGNRWRYGHVTVRSNDPYQIAFEGIVGSSFDGDIAIDDIELTNGACEEEASCDFERGYCGFYNIKQEDNFDWVLNRGETFSLDTGPTVDHTTQTSAGQYVYIESSFPQTYGDKAWLVSEVLESPRGACLEFWYHMKGNTTGNMTVYHRILDRTMTSIWFMEGDQGDRWLNAKVDIPPTAEHYDFLFQGVVGDGFESDMALDDVSFTQGGTCAYLASTTPSPVTPASALFECDFEDGTTCEWQDETSTKPWKVASGETAIFGQAPLTDHTKQNVKGKYALVQVQPTGGALYYSTIGFRGLPRGLSICLDFWYQAFVSSDTTLNVYLQNGTSPVVMIWQRPGTTARDEWTHATVNLGVIRASMHLTISVGVIPRTTGYVAIDDVKLLNGACQSVRICDFEDPLICGYQNDATADFVWERNSGATASISTGASNDHTYESKVGHYMFIETSLPREPGDKARLISPEYPVAAGGSCLQFFYHMYGQDTGALNVLLKSGQTLQGSPLWALAGDQGDLWRPARVGMLTGAKFQVVFEGIVGPSYLGDISIDDISVLPGACGGQGSCTFEQDLCTWTPSKNTIHFDWYRLTSKQISLLYNGTKYPQVDTTIGSQFGHFLWAASDFRTNHQNQTSRIHSEILLAYKNQAGSCLTFSYFITGSSSLRVYARQRPEGMNTSLVWTMENDQGTAWLRDQVDFPAVTHDFEIFFEGKFDYPGTAGSIALDDIYIYSTPCAEVTSTPSPSVQFDCGDGTTVPQSLVCNFIADCPNGQDEQVCADCTFEQGTCRWVDNSVGAFAWKRGQGMYIAPAHTGPVVDHTTNTGQGFYMYVSVSDGLLWDEAILELQQILQPSSASCELEFWYHMMDDHFLSVHLLEGTDSIDIWEQFDAQGDQWIRVLLPLGRIARPWQLQFMAESSFGEGTIALDDIRLIGCQFPPVRPTCPSDTFRCTRGACIPLNRVCDFTDDCGDNSDELQCNNYVMCSFEEPTGMCGWTQDEDNNVNWELGQGETESFETGPKRDHTLGLPSGHFIFLEASYPAVEGDRARIASPVLNSTGVSCEFRFFWHLYGEDIGALNVYTRTTYGGAMNKIWSKDFEVGDFWTRADLLLLVGQPFQVVLEAIVGDGYAGDIAIDDTSFTPGCILSNINLPTVTTTPAISTTPNPCAANGQFQCVENGQCIDAAKVCDFKIDCPTPGGSDESECGTCSFDNNNGTLCSWKDVSFGELEWKLTQGATNLGPSGDHTTGSGFYVALQSSDWFSYASLRSRDMGPSGIECQLKFWYYMNFDESTDTSSIVVYFRRIINDTTRFELIQRIDESTGSQWQQAVINLGRQTLRFAIEIDGSVSETNGIGLDDIEFFNCPAVALPILDLPIDCTFEHGWCNYFHDDTGDFQWERTNQTSPTTSTGPGFDHTTGSGYYIYIETSFPREENDRARVISALQSPTTGPRCLIFWYHMFGADIGALNAFVETMAADTGAISTTLVWQKSGSQGNQWLRASQSLSGLNKNATHGWRVAFEGVVGKGYLGDIALDDIFISPSECPPTKECNFELNLCEFQPIPANSWIYQQATNLSNFVNQDHTTSTSLGHFALALQDNAKLHSRQYSNIGNECVRFWYFINGPDGSTGKLTVASQSVVSGNPINQWSNDLYENAWRYGQVTVNGGLDAFKVVFGASKSTTEVIIGIDDVEVDLGTCPPPVNCNFEAADLCSWTQMKNDQLDWLLQQGATDSHGTGPTVDHTTGSTQGWYIFLEASFPAVENDRVRIISEHMTAGQGCFSLWYHMLGEDVGSLIVYTDTPSDKMRQVAQINGAQGDMWMQMNIDVAVTIQNKESMQLVIEGVVGKGYEGDIGIDDITWQPGVTCASVTTSTQSVPVTTTSYPPTLYDCDFECNCTCKWTDDTTTNFKWIVFKGETGTFDTGPDGDHTTGSRFGHYIYIETSSPAKFNDTARLISPDLTVSNQESCFRFYYHMFGSDVYRLNVYARINGNLGKPLWQKEGNQGNQWLFGRIALRGNVDLQVGQSYQLVLEGIVGQSFQGDISVDDVALNQGPCPTSTVCDFESSDICSYVNDPTNQIDWRREQAGSNAEVPPVDVTYGTSHGHFVYLQTRANTTTSGRLITPSFPDTSGSCVRWHMRLENNATLKVRTFAFGTLNPNEIYSISGSQGADWKLAQTTVKSSTPFQIVFEGLLLPIGDSQDAVAIDDVEIRSGACAPIATCDFEQNLCGFQLLKADFNWKRTSANIELSSAPLFDHTTNSRAGFYLFMDRRQTIAGKKARIESELIPVGVRCISFWYYMNNTVGAQLNIYVRDIRLDKSILIWSTDQIHGSFWVQQQVTVQRDTIAPESTTYTIVYEAVVGSKIGDLAIDDLSSQNGACPSTIAPANTYKCLDGTLIPKAKVCDFIVDCKGGDDERSCGNCTFDESINSLCGWSDVSQGDLEWRRGSNFSAGSINGPTFDHTTYKPTGSYIYLTKGSGTAINSPARFITPILREASSTCTFEFWVYLTGTTSDQLNVKMLTGNGIERATLQRFHYQSTLNWTKISIEVGRIDVPFQLAMDSRHPVSFGSVSFDDTKLLHCHLPPIVPANQCSLSTQFHCARGSCISKSRLCDLTDDCGDHSDESSRLCASYQTCTFDISICDWQHDPTGEFKWELIQGQSPSDETGPNRDHTTGYATGQYLMIEASYPQLPGHKARLISRPFSPTSTACRMFFYYHMLGEDMGELNVYVRFYSNGPLEQIFSVSGERGNAWIRREQPLNYTVPFQVIIEGVVGSSFLSDIGLDDTVFSPECTVYPSPVLPITTLTSTAAPTPCPIADQYRCAGSDVCIDQNKVCDFFADCPDGSDEYRCGPCNFEKDQCGWEDLSLTYYQWMRVQGQSASNISQAAPGFDHTLNTPAGWYMHVAGDMGDFFDLADLRSPPLPASGPNCEITFYYWLVGNTTGTLYLISSTNATPLWSQSSSQARRWIRTTVPVGANPAQWKLRFELEPNLDDFWSRTDDVAIDDISFAGCNDNRSLHIFACDFEMDMCSWETNGLADFNWTRTSSKTPSLDTGPQGDHTTGSGSYVYIEASLPQTAGDRAWLASPMIPATTANCLVFYYHMFGADIGTLNIISQTSATNTTLFSRTGSGGNVWRRGQTELRSTLPYRIIFEGIIGKSWEGDIALDDIEVNSGFCPPLDECDFEHGWCEGWESGAEGDFEWKRARNGSTPGGTPTVDHTLSSPTGHFLYIDPTNRVSGDEAHLQSPSYKGSQPRCLRMWYHLYGAGIGSLQIQQKPEIGRARTLWTKSNNQDNIWRQIRLTIPTQLGTSTYKIQIVGIVGASTAGDIAIDDISNIEGECPDASACTFEEDLCGWVNGENGKVDEFDWLLNTGETPSVGTGPTVDHTLGTPEGHYLYIEASALVDDGAKAWLISEHYDSGPYCMVFYYHLYGTDIGMLSVYTRIGVSKPQLEWSLSGDHGNQWRVGSINVDMGAEFYFIIEGRIGKSFLGDMAIDDIFVIPNSVCTIPTTTTTTTAITTVGIHNPLSCNFENTTCKWTDDTSLVGRWSLHQGQSNDFHTGPHFDHTLQTADGWYIDTSKLTSNQKARLISTMTSIPTRGICFRFWYRSYGSKGGTLSLYQRAANELNETLIFILRGNPDVDWREAIIFRQTFGNFQFILEGQVGLVLDGSDNIAVDDITTSEGTCPSIRTCDFESVDVCGYINDQSSNFNWTRHKGSTSSLFTGPQVDHTTLTVEGHYMYIETSAPRKQGEVARLVSPIFPPSTEYNCLQFYYHQYGIDVGTLNVYKRDVGGSLTPLKLFTAEGNRLDEWHVMEINIVPARPYNIIFEGVVGKNFEGDIAIDDVHIKEKYCPRLGDCDFEENICAYKNSEKNRDMDWIRMRGEPGDHTIGTIYGAYLAFDMTATTAAFNRALLISPDMDNTAQYCFQYYYRRFGDGQGTLTISRQTFGNISGPIQLVKHESDAFIDEWRFNQIQLNPVNNQSSNVFRMLFEATKVLGTGRLMLDDFSLLNGVCPPLPSNCSLQCTTATGPGQCIPTSQVCDFNKDCLNGDDERLCGYDCTFESDTCKYIDPSAGDYKWRRQRAGAATPGTGSGPTNDHTTLSTSGYYMIVSTNNGSIDQRAHLISPRLQQSSATCEMTFYYHMAGVNVGRLEVLLVQGVEASRIFSIDGSQGLRWHKAVVKIGRLYRPFSVWFDARKTATTLADIAIDDIQWIGCGLPEINNETTPCTATQFQCKRGGCIEQSRLCDNTDDCGDMSDEDNSTCFNTHLMSGCNFESDLCKLRNLFDMDLEFARTRSEHLAEEYAPQRDHTLNNRAGSYLYVNTLNQQPNRIAQMASTRYQSLTGCTARFYYLTNGPANPGQLSVMTRTLEGGPLTYLWSTTKIIGNHWERQEVRLPVGDRFEFLFEVKTLGGGGIIAIDDLSFSSQCVGLTGYLPFGTTLKLNGTTSTSQPCAFRCNTGTCITKEKRCNFASDCPSGEDEKDCGQCDFETNTCGWYDDSQGYYVWARRNASSIISMPGDATTNKTSGFLMTVAGGSGSFAGSSRLVSERIASTAASCRITFAHYRNRDKDGTLALYIEDDQNFVTKIWSDPMNTIRPIWTPITVSIGRRRTGFRFVFISTHAGSIIQSDLSIDDFVFRDCAINVTGHCESFTDPFNCSNGNCIHQDNLCDFSDDCGDNTDEQDCDAYGEMCSFEDHAQPICSWSHDDSADFRWQRVRGDTVTNNDWLDYWDLLYGPDRDHTLGTSQGHFLFLETSEPRKPNDTARVVSPVLGATTSGQCQFRFWYHALFK